jgi:hypothetical protein
MTKRFELVDCPSCNSRVSRFFRYCPRCRVDLPTPAPTEPDAESLPMLPPDASVITLLECSACGGSVSPRVRACPHCGEPRPSFEEHVTRSASVIKHGAQAASATTLHDSTKGLGAAIGIMVIICMVVGFIYIARNGALDSWLANGSQPRVPQIPNDTLELLSFDLEGTQRGWWNLGYCVASVPSGHAAYDVFCSNRWTHHYQITTHWNADLDGYGPWSKTSQVALHVCREHKASVAEASEKLRLGLEYTLRQARSMRNTSVSSDVQLLETR